MAATYWPTNAHLIADVARLGYITRASRTLDVTFGRGVWWQKFKPDSFVGHDLAIDGVDFRCLPYAADTFDVVAFDPPYVSTGGRASSTIGEFNDRYGLTTAPTSPEALFVLMAEGLAECARVTRKTVLVKCQDYVSSGNLFMGSYKVLKEAERLGLRCVDRFEMLASPRPQPAHRRQVHARRNYSTLFVLEKPKKVTRRSPNTGSAHQSF